MRWIAYILAFLLGMAAAKFFAPPAFSQIICPNMIRWCANSLPPLTSHLPGGRPGGGNNAGPSLSFGVPEALGSTYFNDFNANQVGLPYGGYIDG